MVAGPLVLLRDRRFNDVVDGATFGVASAVAFVGAQVIAGSIDLFADGPTPVGEPLPWIARILAIAVALPVVAAGAIGSAVGRVLAPLPRAASATGRRWASPAVRRSRARWRRPCWSRRPSPPICPGRSSTSRSSSALAAVALLWLRRVLHLGLLEEAFEIEIGDEVVCANCGQADAPPHVLRELRDLAPRPAQAARGAATMSGPASRTT